MDFASLDLDARIFGQGDAVELTRADVNTIDNWIKHGHLVVERIGGRRLFTAADLITIELMIMMQGPFKILRPEVSCVIAGSALSEYRQHFPADLRDIASGRDWRGLHDERGGTTWGLTRAEDGSLRAAERGDVEAQSVMIDLPTRLLARGVLAKIQIWMGGRE